MSNETRLHQRIEAMCARAEHGMTLPILFVTDVRRLLADEEDIFVDDAPKKTPGSPRR